MCDEKGKVIDGDQIIAMLAKRWKEKKILKGGVVGTLMSNYGLEEFLKKENIKFLRANVGDRYVKEIMKKNKFNLGGEQSGHIILGKFATTGDGLLVALEVLFSLRKGKKASNLFNVYKSIPQILENITVKDKNIINSTKSFMINDIKVTPIPVPHDAREPFQFMLESNLKSMAIITDLGHITNYIIKTLKEINALVIEFNHDKNMLINSDYPQSLKDRVSGIYGHLENMESIKLLESINYQGIEWIAAAHLSEKNNDEKLVKRLIADVTKKGPESIKVIDQINGIDWLDI